MSLFQSLQHHLEVCACRMCFGTGHVPTEITVTHGFKFEACPECNGKGITPDQAENFRQFCTDMGAWK